MLLLRPFLCALLSTCTVVYGFQERGLPQRKNLRLERRAEGGTLPSDALVLSTQGLLASTASRRLRPLSRVKDGVKSWVSSQGFTLVTDGSRSGFSSSIHWTQRTT